MQVKYLFVVFSFLGRTYSFLFCLFTNAKEEVHNKISQIYCKQHDLFIQGKQLS